ncbi:MAG: hypothetical protein IT376_14005 [Polyangiaceae bacterium]|nr:hypothetical protein [Polyangiaceae bacterium]
MSGRRVAVTGVGAITALGGTATETFRALVEGRRGIGPVRWREGGDHRTRVAAEVAAVPDGGGLGPAPRSRCERLAIAAAREAVAVSGVSPGGVGGVVVGTTTGGMREAERALARLARGDAPPDLGEALLGYPLSATAEAVARAVAPGAVARTVTSACSSAAAAIALGSAAIERGLVRAVLVGGVDALCHLTWVGFDALGALDPEGCRPFDRRRAGLSIGEGAAFLVLEREADAAARGARVWAWLAGWALGAEAFHPTQPEPSGARPAAAVRAALERAGLAPSAIDWVNAHGTGTPQNDAMEAAALRLALGEAAATVRVSSCKGQLGHTLGAAGAVAAVVSVLALVERWLPATGGLTEPDPALGLRHVAPPAERVDARVVLSTSFGVGGAVAARLFEHAEAPPRASAAGGGPAPATLCVTAAVASARDGGAARRALEPRRTRRFDGASMALTAVCADALATAGVAARGVGLVAGNGLGALGRAAAFLARVDQSGPRFAPPAEFPQIVPFATVGNASIYLGLEGPVVGVADLETSAEAALAVVAAWIDDETPFLCGAYDVVDAFTERLFGGDPPEAPPTAAAAVLLVETPAGAARRGAHVLARLEPLDARPLPAARAWLAATAPAGAVVVGTGGAELAALLAESPWAAVPRTVAGSDGGPHRAPGTLALVRAVELVEAGAREVVALALARGQVHLTRVSAP